MKFADTVLHLEKGGKITREPWKGVVYFVFDGSEVKSYQPKLLPYVYSEDIMLSKGWQVEGVAGEYKFGEIIPFLQVGKKCKLNAWRETYIYFDQSIKSLAIHSMEVFPFSVDFDSFVAQDWITVE